MQKFGYNGKELTEELGLEWHDFGARNYDAAIGRWMNLDNLADSEHSISFNPYHYAANNPIVFVDPDGQDWFYYKAEGDNGPSYHYHEGSEYEHQYTYKDSDGVEHTETIVLQGTSSFTAKDQNGDIFMFNNDGSITDSEATVSLLEAGGIDTSSFVEVTSKESENGIEIREAGANVVAVAALSFAILDTATPDPSDAFLPKWAVHGMLSTASLYLLSESTITLQFAQRGKNNGKLGPGELESLLQKEAAGELTKLQKQKLKNIGKIKGKGNPDKVRIKNKKMDLGKIASLNFIEANRSIISFVNSQEVISDNDLQLLLKLKEVELISTFLEKYDKFTQIQLIEIEKYINENLNLSNRDFVSDLIDFSSDWALNINYSKLLEFLSLDEEEEHFVVLSSINYITENIKLFYIKEILKSMKGILDNGNYFQNVQISAALCLFRITQNNEYLLEIKDWFTDEDNKQFLLNKLKLDYYDDTCFPNIKTILLNSNID